MVRRLVEGRILFTPDRENGRYIFRMTGTLANFFSGIVCPQAMASSRRIARVGAPETFIEGPIAA
jgi:hypothetical protein